MKYRITKVAPWDLYPLLKVGDVIELAGEIPQQDGTDREAIDRVRAWRRPDGWVTIQGRAHGAVGLGTHCKVEKVEPSPAFDDPFTFKPGDKIRIVEFHPKSAKLAFHNRYPEFEVGKVIEFVDAYKSCAVFDGWPLINGCAMRCKKVVEESKAPAPAPSHLEKPDIKPEDGWSFLAANEDIDSARIFREADEAGYDAIEISTLNAPKPSYVDGSFLYVKTGSDAFKSVQELGISMVDARFRWQVCLGWRHVYDPDREEAAAAIRAAREKKAKAAAKAAEKAAADAKKVRVTVRKV